MCVINLSRFAAPGLIFLIPISSGSYGSLARFTDLRRLRTVGSQSIIGAGGDYSDFQFVMDMLDEKMREDRIKGDDVEATARQLHSYLSRVMYNRRNKMDPLWNSLVVAGFDGDEPTLGVVDLIGTTYEEDFLATGFGLHLAIPILRERWSADMSREDAEKLLKDCMRVLFYRDCRTINKIQFAAVTKEMDGSITAETMEPVSLDTKWDYASFVRPKAGADTGGSW